MKISFVVVGEYMKISCADPEIFFRGVLSNGYLSLMGRGGLKHIFGNFIM